MHGDERVQNDPCTLIEIVVGLSCTEIPRLYVCLNSTQDYALLPCLLLLSSMSACSAALGYKLPVW